MFLCPDFIKMEQDFMEIFSIFYKKIRNLYGNFTICEYVLCYNEIEAGGRK